MRDFLSDFGFFLYYGVIPIILIFGAFLEDIDEQALYLVFEKVIAEINRRKAVKENGKI